MRDLAVVALEEVLADDLPVRLELGLPARVEAKGVDVEPELGDLRRHRAERLGERLRSRCVFDEHERAPGVDGGAAEAELVLREVRLLVRPRRRAERAVEAVRPRVVRALQRLALALALGDREAAVAADVEERAQLAVACARDDHRRLPRAPREERPRLGKLPEMADVLPRGAEDPLLLAAQDLRIRVPAIRKRRLHDSIVGSADGRSCTLRAVLRLPPLPAHRRAHARRRARPLRLEHLGAVQPLVGARRRRLAGSADDVHGEHRARRRRPRGRHDPLHRRSRRRRVPPALPDSRGRRLAGAADRPAAGAARDRRRRLVARRKLVRVLGQLASPGGQRGVHLARRRRRTALPLRRGPVRVPGRRSRPTARS